MPCLQFAILHLGARLDGDDIELVATQLPGGDYGLAMLDFGACRSLSSSFWSLSALQMRRATFYGGYAPIGSEEFSRGYLDQARAIGSVELELAAAHLRAKNASMATAALSRGRASRARPWRLAES